jgi:predicted transcriptional regulator
LAAGQTTSDRIAGACRISLPALSRHLAKLERRAVVHQEDRAWRLRPAADPLAAVLLAAVLHDGDRS